MRLPPAALPACLAACLLLALPGCLRGPISFDGPGTAEGRNPDLDGLVLRAAVTRATEGRLRLDATLDNEGSHTYGATNACTIPWGMTMTDDRGRTLGLREPSVTCAALGIGPVPPGASLRFNHTWDGRLWEDGKAFDAAPGAYTWHVRFNAYTGSSVQDMGEQHALETGIPVRVG
ncbi:MAG TPA: hypothetical protein VM241_07180 [Candidatus Thermoplasmatota archaeon]|nr:hypothetical protein [Candidatus Thermoplasmatota archaeon]